jgi:pimeloyl-ACP methyl ester carboxylesterase
MVAQCLVRAHPQRVATLGLFLTAPPDPARVPSHRRYQSAFRWLPSWLIRSIAGLGLRSGLAAVPSEKAFWLAYMRGRAELYNRAEALAGMDRAIDYDLNHRFTDTDLRDWPGRILLMDSDDDPVVPPAARAELRRLYPGAQTYTFTGTQHSASLLRPREFAANLGGFLKQGAVAAEAVGDG